MVKLTKMTLRGGGLALLAVVLILAMCPSMAKAKCTFDFAAASERLYGGKMDGADLLAGVKWNHTARLSSYDIKRTDPRWVTAVKGVRSSNSGNEYVTENPPEILTALGGDERVAKMTVSAWQVYLNLPDAEGGRYRLSYLYSMSHTLGHQGMTMVIFFSGKKVVKTEPCYLSNVDSGEFPFCRTLTVPKGVDRLCLDNRLSALGKLRFWNAALVKLPKDKPVVLRQAANGWFTRTFEISKGQTGIVCWHWRRGFGTDPKEIRNMTCLLTVPPGFVVEGVSFGKLPKAPKTLPDGSREYRFSPDHWLRPKEDFSTWHRLGATISSQDAIGTRGTLKLAVVSADGTPLADETETELVVAEPVHAPRPKRFISGIELGGWYWRTLDGRDTEMLAKMSGDAGFNGVFQHGATKETSATFRKFGALEVLQGSASLCNGYCIGPEKGRPESDKYVFKNPGHQFAGRSACPLSVSEEREFFMNVTVPWLKKQTEGSGTDALWTNWEPYYFAKKGCMCDKCRAAFAKYVGVPDEEMAKDWPKELDFGGKWHDRIERFRSIQHGKLVRTISKHANVIFGIFWGEMSSAWRPRNLAAEVQAIDYAGDVKTMCPWGPYPCWNTQGSYAKSRATCLSSFCAAKDVRAQVNKDYTAGRRPRLMALPSGCSFGCDWVGQPEWLVLQTLSFFFNGWEASYMCGFPRGYDARYWRAMADANVLIAKYEDFVYDGRRTDGKVRLAPKRPFRVIPNVSSYLDWTRAGAPVVQFAAYELNGKRMVALLNFADEEDAEFDLYYDGKLIEAGVRLEASTVKVISGN